LHIDVSTFNRLCKVGDRLRDAQRQKTARLPNELKTVVLKGRCLWGRFDNFGILGPDRTWTHQIRSPCIEEFRRGF